MSNQPYKRADFFGPAVTCKHPDQKMSYDENGVWYDFESLSNNPKDLTWIISLQYNRIVDLLGTLLKAIDDEEMTIFVTQWHGDTQKEYRTDVSRTGIQQILAEYRLMFEECGMIEISISGETNHAMEIAISRNKMIHLFLAPSITSKIHALLHFHGVKRNGEIIEPKIEEYHDNGYEGVCAQLLIRYNFEAIKQSS